jgi:hypothetical protein
LLSNLSALSVHDEGYFERTWWRLFWAYMMKVILSVHDECYFERTWWRLFWAYMMKVILSVHDECYFERTWWMLFWAYMMKVILSVHDEGYYVHDEGYFSNASYSLNLISTFLLVFCVLFFVLFVIGFVLFVIGLGLMTNDNCVSRLFNLECLFGFSLSFLYFSMLVFSRCNLPIFRFNIYNITHWLNVRHRMINCYITQSEKSLKIPKE